MGERERLIVDPHNEGNGYIEERIERRQMVEVWMYLMKETDTEGAGRARG